METRLKAKVRFLSCPARKSKHSEFDGDKMSGYLKAPLVGKIKIKDGVKVG